MRIGIACHETVGGSGTLAVSLAQALASYGHGVHLIARDCPLRLEPDRLPHGLRLHRYGCFDYPPIGTAQYALTLASKLAEVAWAERLDLLHVHYAVPHAVSAYLAREMLRGRHRLPIVTTLHGTDVTIVGNDPSYHAVTRFALAQCDGLTAVSRYLADQVDRNFQLPGVRVIPNFVNPDLFQRGTDDSGLRSRLAPRGQKLLIHVSNFRPVKQVGQCVEVLARLARCIPCRLVMVGDGPETRTAHERARQLGVEHDVLFVGVQSRIEDYLSVADLLLLPSQTESFGLAALEAMSCEVPVIASAVGGLPEVIEDRVTGRLLPPGDIEGMAAAAVEILTNRDLHQAMGQACRSRVLALFNANRVVPLYLDDYRQVIDRLDSGRALHLG